MKKTRKGLFRVRRTRRQRVSDAERKHYYLHREEARSQITNRIEYWNQFYNFKYNRIAIKNHQRRWGSCSSLGNLNFNYKLLFLPSHLLDYVVVHELCHLQELHHGKRFWQTVAQTLPHYKSLVHELRQIEQTFGVTHSGLIKAQAHYQSRATTRDWQPNDGVTTSQQCHE